MILFCDTSALLKLYVVESESALIREQAALAQAVAVCRIAWVEAHSALSRRGREVPSDLTTMEAAKLALASDWSHYFCIEVTQSLVELAGNYADMFALRAYDSVQLACASEIARLSEMPVIFASFDLRLNKAAKLLGLRGL